MAVATEDTRNLKPKKKKKYISHALKMKRFAREQRKNPPANAFQPGNQISVGNEGGRPEIWTREKLLELTDKFYKWMQRPDVMYVKTFCHENGFLAAQADEFCLKCPEFSLAWKKSKQWQEQRLITNAITKQYSEGMVKFVLTNVHGWREKSEISGDVMNPLASMLDKIAKQQEIEEAEIVPQGQIAQKKPKT